MSTSHSLSRQQIRLLLPLGLGMALSVTGDLTLYAVLPNRAEAVGVSLAAVGILLAANRLIRIPGNIVAGALYDRHGRKRLYLSGLSLGVVSTLCYSLVRGFWPLLAARLLWGVAWSLINVGGYTMIVDFSTPADRGRMTGWYQTAFLLGQAISPLLGGTLTDLVGFDPALRLCAAVSGAGLVAVVVALPETRPADPRSTATAWQWAPRVWFSNLVSSLRGLDRPTWVAGTVYMAVFLVNGEILMSTLSLYIGQRWGASVSLGATSIGVASLAGAMLGLRSLLAMLAGPAVGAASDRSQRRWPFVWGGLSIGVLGFLLLALRAAWWSGLLGVVLVAVSAGAVSSTVAALVGDRARDGRAGATMGGLATAGDLGSAAGPLLAYALVATTDLRWVYLICAAVLLVGLLLVATVRE